MKARALVKFNSAVIKELFLIKEETSFGRKPGNDVVIDHPTISGFHAKIRRTGDDFFVDDLNSTNGTYLNGHRITKSKLKDKDQVGLAGHIVEIVLVSEEETARPLTTPAAESKSDLKVSLEPAPMTPGIPVPGLDAPPIAPPSAPSPAVASIQKPAMAPEEAQRQREILRKSLGLDPATGSSLPATHKPAPQAEAPLDLSATPEPKIQGAAGSIRIVAGGVNGQTEIQLKDLVTYIGTSDQAQIKIKGILAPSLAAAISRRKEGYFLKAIKAGYPKVNGNAVQEQIFLENGALIEVAGTNMVFYHGDSKAPTSTPVAPDQKPK